MWEFPWTHFLPPSHPKGCGFAAPGSESDARNSVSSQEGLGDRQSLDSEHQNCRVDLGSAVEMEAQLHTNRKAGEAPPGCTTIIGLVNLGDLHLACVRVQGTR